MTRPSYILLLAFTFFLIQSASAQFFAGFSGGMNLSNACFTSEVNFPDSKASTFAFGGIHSGYKLHEKWTFTTDLHFSQKGYWSDYEGFPDPVTNTYARYSYIDLVPQMEYTLHKHLAIGAGVFVSRLWQDDYSTTGNEWFPPVQRGILARMDAGAVASLKLKLKDLFFFTRYQHGLADIHKLRLTDVNGNEIDVRQRNIVFQFGLGYVFLHAKTEN